MHWMGFRKSDQERSTGYLEISKNLGREGGREPSLPPREGGQGGRYSLVGEADPKKTSMQIGLTLSLGIIRRSQEECLA